MLQVQSTSSINTNAKSGLTITNLYYHIRSIKRRGYYLFHRPSLCGVYSRAAFINTSSCQREAILREMVDWYHWSRRFWPLCWCWCRRLKLVLDCLSCTCHRKRIARHVHVLVFSNSRRGAATIRERPLFHLALPEVQQLIESGVWSSEYGILWKVLIIYFMSHCKLFSDN